MDGILLISAQQTIIDEQLYEIGPVLENEQDYKLGKLEFPVHLKVIAVRMNDFKGSGHYWSLLKMFTIIILSWLQVIGRDW